MSLLKVENLSHSFAEKKLYDQASFELYKGEHMGVVGQNGAGKSTLIKILTGEVIPDKGEIVWQSNAQIGHLDQYAQVDGQYTINEYLQTAFANLMEMEQRMNYLYEESAANADNNLLMKAVELQEQLEANDFYQIDSNIQKIASGLGIDAIGMDRKIQTLSGGQRAKVILAKLLLEQPNVLLLDEPTNFLDKEHVEWLASYLTTFKGAFIVVSHDDRFLEKITTCICNIELGMIKKYHGTFSDFIRQKEHLKEDYIRQYRTQQRHIEKTEAYIRKNIAGNNSKIAKGRRKQLDRMERMAAPTTIQKPTFEFREIPLQAQTTLAVHDLEVGYGTPLLPKINLSVAAGEKLIITGFNGIGKSTLLKTLVRSIPAISGKFRFSKQVKVGYYEQDLKWEDGRMTPMQVISDAYPKLTKKEIFSHLARCGVKDEHVTQAIRSLSGGEQAKVRLCLLLLSPTNFLILDEPTNHLDIDAKEALQQALIAFSGSLILVSHEADFYQGWTDRILNIGN
jgi:ATPase subunit of ABC transporter with duplicated ATPase domains